MFEHNPNLTELNLFGCEEIEGKFPGGFFCDQSRQDRSSNFSVVGNIEVFQATPNLVNLDLEECYKIEGKFLESSFATSI